MFDLQGIGRLLAIVGLGMIVLGGLLWIGGRLGLGSLPGDVEVSGERWGCYVPIVSMIVLSLVLTVIVNLVIRFLNR